MRWPLYWRIHVHASPRAKVNEQQLAFLIMLYSSVSYSMILLSDATPTRHLSVLHNWRSVNSIFCSRAEEDPILAPVDRSHPIITPLKYKSQWLSDNTSCRNYDIKYNKKLISTTVIINTVLYLNEIFRKHDDRSRSSQVLYLVMMI